MRTDTLSRRLRFAPPQPTDTTIKLGERDFILFEKIHQHGPLPATYLHEFTRNFRKNFNFHQRRLTQLYNGTEDGSTYLARPPQQFASFAARYQPLIYDLAPPALRLLAEHGRLPRFVPPRTDPFLHRLMGSCVSSSIELAATERGLRYLMKPDIFAHASCPDRTREAANPVAMPLSSFAGAKALIPDDLFGIEYPGVKPAYRFFAVEIDRNTESIERRKLDQTAYGRKLHAYMEVMKSRTYRDWWGVPNLMVLTVTTNVTHMDNMLAFLMKVGEPSLANRFLFKAKPDFGSNWRVPPVMRDLLSDPWRSTVGEFRADKP